MYTAKSEIKLTVYRLLVNPYTGYLESASDKSDEDTGQLELPLDSDFSTDEPTVLEGNISDLAVK